MIAVWNPLLSSTFTVAISDATRGGRDLTTCAYRQGS